MAKNFTVSMDIKLTADEEKLRKEISKQLEKVDYLLRNYRMDDEVQKLIEKMGKNAHKLHMSLKKNGYNPRHHEYMIKNRGVEPEDPSFYMNIHPVEDLLKYTDDPDANDDPKDQTIGQEFEFRVYSRRWGHEDTYSIRRTAEGWNILPISRGGPCDKSGQPFLFEKLHQDFIQYPHDLDGRLEWLWEQAASRGLSKDEVQTALNDLANWVSSTEKNSPSGGLWEDY